MATFTMYFKEAIEAVYGDSMDADDYEQVYAPVEFGDVKYGKLPTLPDPMLIGLGSYPIFNEAYRAILNGKIIDEYWNREICTETVDNFTLMLRRKMDQIMPYYNKLYESELIEYKALSSINIESQTSNDASTQGDGTATVVSESDVLSKSRAVNSSTPQTMLSGNEDYATSSSDTNSNAETDSTSTNETSNTTSSANTGTSLVTGYQGAASDLITKYRNTLLNIDTLVIADVQDCFMLLLNNGDAFTRNGWYY